MKKETLTEAISIVKKQHESFATHLKEKGPTQNRTKSTAYEAHTILFDGTVKRRKTRCAFGKLQARTISIACLRIMLHSFPMLPA